MLHQSINQDELINILDIVVLINFILGNETPSTNEFTIADISAAASISIIDYLGEIKWKDYSYAKEWYARIKSRPSFRKILEDKIGRVTARV